MVWHGQQPLNCWVCRSSVTLVSAGMVRALWLILQLLDDIRMVYSIYMYSYDGIGTIHGILPRPLPGLSCLWMVSEMILGIAIYGKRGCKCVHISMCSWSAVSCIFYFVVSALGTERVRLYLESWRFRLNFDV